MSHPPRESILSLSLREAVGADYIPEPSLLEAEVVALFDQLRERLLRYLLGFRIPIQDGEEILQEVFLALFQHLQQGKSRKNLSGWVFRVAHNLALKRCRPNGSICQTDAPTTRLDELVVDPDPNPEDRLASQQTFERLQAVLQVLSEQDQRCLALRAEGLRYREIASVLDISLGAVALSLSRSLGRLARAFQR